jgi:hypothetical protein
VPKVAAHSLTQNLPAAGTHTRPGHHLNAATPSVGRPPIVGQDVEPVFDEEAARAYLRTHRNNATMEGMLFVKKLLAQREAELRKNERRKKKRLGKRLAEAMRIDDPEAQVKAFDKLWRSAKPAPPPEPAPAFAAALARHDDRQRKLVDHLFRGAYLAVAWRMAGYSRKHHASIGKLLSSPTTRAYVIEHLNRGGKLRGKLHQAVIDKLGWRPVRLEDLI